MSCNMESCILFENTDKSVVLIDIPRSIEQAQTPNGHLPGRRILSSTPVETPWQSLASKKHQEPDISRSPSIVIDELMTLESVRRAYDEIKKYHTGIWCLPRMSTPQIQDAHTNEKPSLKRRKEGTSSTDDEHENTLPPPYIPAESHHLLGGIESLRETFSKTAPAFDLIILDPPWPSRSVKRKKNSYETAYRMEDIENLLRQLPIASHMDPDGSVAVWVTNKPAVIELLKSPGGIFSQWGLEFISEWIWVKLTNHGQPIVDLESEWRKPWERLLIARKKGSSLSVERKVIFAVPDIHSRKPSLKCLFDTIMAKQYKGLEVFARNLTAGWWSWGNQVLMFQQRHHWIEEGFVTEEPKVSL